MLVVSYRRCQAAIVALIGMLLSGGALLAAVATGAWQRLVTEPVWAPVWLSGYGCAVVFGLMCGSMFWQAAFRGGRAAWIQEGIFHTATWSVSVNEILCVNFREALSVGLARADVIEFELLRNKKKYMSVAMLRGAGEQIAADLRRALWK